MENQLHNTLSTEGAKVYLDRTVKKLLSIRYVLGFIMTRAIKEYKGCTIEEAMAAIDGDPIIASKDLRSGHVEQETVATRAAESASSEKGRIYYDIVFFAYAPSGERQMLWINLEYQDNYYPGYDLVPRGIFYCARLLGDELDKEFNPDNYDDIKKVYSIWICMNAPHADHLGRPIGNTIVEYHVTPTMLYSECENDIARIHTGRYDLMSAIFINIAQNGSSESDLIGMLRTMFSKTIGAEDKIRTLSEQYGLPMTTETSKEVHSMCNYSESIYEDGKAAGKAEGLAEAAAQYQSQLDAKNAEIHARDAELDAKNAALDAKDAQISALKAQLAAATH